MTVKQILTMISALAAISHTTMNSAYAADGRTSVAELTQEKLSRSSARIEELAGLRDIGFSEEEVDHMQHLLLHKMEYSRSGRIPPSHQLVAKKVEESAAEMQALSELSDAELSHRDVELIQQAMLHKLNHMRDEAYFVSFN